jgi:hypothetical protein
MEQAYSMLDMKVTGLTLRTYTTTVGNEVARASVTMFPEEDHVNTWSVEEAFSTRKITLSNLVAKRFKEVTMAPLGPRPYCFIVHIWTQGTAQHGYCQIE